MRVPEEINRRIVDHTADINLTYSTIARDYLLREGLPPDRVIKTGSPMFEVLTTTAPRIEASDVLQRLGLQDGQLLRRQRAPRGEHRIADAVSRKLVAVLNAVAEDHRPAGHRFHPSAHAEADRGHGRHASIRRCGC